MKSASDVYEYLERLSLLERVKFAELLSAMPTVQRLNLDELTDGKFHAITSEEYDVCLFWKSSLQVSDAMLTEALENVERLESQARSTAEPQKRKGPNKNTEKWMRIIHEYRKSHTWKAVFALLKGTSGFPHKSQQVMEQRYGRAKRSHPHLFIG